MFRFTIRRMFGFMPERSTRYFTLSVQLKEDLPLSDNILEQHHNQIKKAQQRGQILLATQAKQSKHLEYLFQSPNEIEPYNFIKQSPFALHNMISSYIITEIQMQLKVKDKELAPAYLRE